MVRVVWRFGRFRSDRRGITAIEYAIMAGAIAVALVLAMANLNGGIRTTFSTAAAAFPK